ncbi:hypothetical protein UlMin_040670 [Ulmus minor]
MGKTINLYVFCSSLSAETVKGFVEEHTGEGTVYAIKLRPFKNNVSRSFAIVQFTSSRDAERMISVANNVLWYGRFYIKARPVEQDIVPKPRAFLHRLQNTTLHFGSQISEETFSVLWRQGNVSVDFGIGLRRLNFYLSYHGVEYRLQLSYENLLQIELRRPHGQTAKYLTIQVLGAPRIYEKDICSSLNIYEDPLFNYFKEGPDDQWVRATDFTPSCAIGQSSAICLELPNDCQLPNFQENFAQYKDNKGRFILESGTSFSRNLELVPIVGPPNIYLPYEILFKVNLLLQNGYLAGPTLDVDFYKLLDPQKINLACIEHALEKLFILKECCYEPSVWLKEEYRKYLTSKRPPKPPTISLDSGLVYIRRVQVTPCKVYFCGPEVNVSSRILRLYKQHIDNFLRVSFVDEELDNLYATEFSPRTSVANEDRKTGIYKRVLSVLRNGIEIGDKKFEFLAFSSSQLKENSLWMFAASGEVSAVSIRKRMGNFSSIRNVAKYAARLGQSFGSSKETLSVASNEIETIPDVEVKRGGVNYVFSDGIGKISSHFAKKVAKKCGFNGFTPSAFQIRYGGYKGVVAVDPTSLFKLSLRKSMCKKYLSNLDVLNWSKFQPCYLNRQVITLLSTLGVEDQVFEKKQREAVEQLDSILIDPLRAQQALELMSPGENANIFKELLMCGYKPDAKPFLSLMLQTFRSSKLLELRTKTRIFIPNGRLMMGCLDETRTLEYGEVFVRYSGTKNRQFFEDSSSLNGTMSDQPFLVQGQVVVAKTPCLHPGDVRVLRVVDVPALYHMVDCVVFPQKGPRPHPNECSGSDLDGDDYFVCWDRELIPPRQEVQEFFTNSIVNDSLGMIANRHNAFADKEYNKAMSSSCIELARLHSIAVDFPKTGVPAVIPPHLKLTEFPDFMEKTDKPTYESQNVIGKLFREVRDKVPHVSTIRSFTLEDYIDDAFYFKGNYDYKLGNLLDYYGIKTEAEILSGGIMKMSTYFTKRRDAESINVAVRALRKEARTWFNENGSSSDSGIDDVLAKASAWYHVTYHPSYWGCYNEGLKRDHYLSFPWCVYDKLVKIKRDKASLRRALTSLESRFSRGLQLR